MGVSQTKEPATASKIVKSSKIANLSLSRCTSIISQSNTNTESQSPTHHKLQSKAAAISSQISIDEDISPVGKVFKLDLQNK